MIFVLADDITGAAEIAGICLRYGLDVSFGIDAIPEKVATVNVIATDSRSGTELEAYKIHKQLANEIVSKGNYILFKKCDSVLRGHVLTELCALAKVVNKKRVIFQPANPDAKRCIRDGVYWINDELIEKTGFSVDPDFSIRTSLVKNILLDRVTKHTKIIKIHTGTISEINAEGIFIPDCNSVSDLSKSCDLYNDETVIGGSAPFFEQFLIKMNLVSVKKQPKKYKFKSNYALLSGSTHPESIAFAESIQSENSPLLLLPDNLLEKEGDDAILLEWIKKVSETYNKNKKVVLRISNTIIQFENSSIILKNRMSLIVKGLLELSEIDELFIEGGASAYSVLQKLNWKSFTPVDELALGVVRMQYDADLSKHITIKPGSYKWPSALLK